MPKEYYEDLYSSYTEEMREAYLNGEFVNLKQGRAYKEFDRDKHVIARPDLKDEKGKYKFPICVGADFNVDYLTAEIFVKGNGWIHFIDEIRLSHANTYDLAEVMVKKYSGITAYPDATGAARKTSSQKSDHAILKSYGFTVLARKANPHIKDRVASVNRLLMHDWLTIEPEKCPWLVKDFERVVWDAGDLDQKSDPALTHASSAAGYPIYYLYPVVRRDFGGINV